MPVREGAIAFIDDCDGRYQFMAKVLRKEAPVKKRRERKAWEKAALSVVRTFGATRGVD